MRKILHSQLAVVLFLAPLVAAAQSKPKVAILPVINTSGEKWEQLRTSQVDTAENFLNKEFEDHGFETTPKPNVTSVLSAMKVDLTDEEQWRRQTLFDVGAKAKADFLVLVVITDTGQHKSANFFSTTAEGWVNEKIWLLDVKSKKAILSAKSVRGSSKHSEFVFGTVTGSSLQTVAVANGLRDALKDFFRPYTKAH